MGVDAGSTSTEQTTWALPIGKTCSQCTLQWMWAARRDGGFYVGCADIAITQGQTNAGTQTTQTTSTTAQSGSLLTTTTQSGSLGVNLGAGAYQPQMGVVGGARPLCLRVSCMVTFISALLLLLKS